MILTLLLACTEAPDSALTDTACSAEEEGYALTWSSWGQGFFRTYCDACHAADSPQRFGAPEDVSFDTLEELRRWEARVRVRTLEQGDMPLGGGVHEDDLLLLEAYLDCGL
jgi:uncharacterized membrane protein